MKENPRLYLPGDLVRTPLLAGGGRGRREALNFLEEFFSETGFPVWSLLGNSESYEGIKRKERRKHNPGPPEKLGD
jgi:hypothetical protein